MNSNCSNLLEMRNLQEQVKKAFCYQKLFWPFTVWINYFSDLKIFANFQPSASNFKNFSPSLEHFFLTQGQNNFGNKIPILSTNIRFWFIFTYYFSYINKRKCRQFQSILKRTLFLTFRKLKKQGHYVTKIIFFSIWLI